MANTFKPKKRVKCDKCGWTGMRGITSRACPKCGFWYPHIFPVQKASRRRVLQGCPPSANCCLGARATRKQGADSSVVASAEAVRREGKPSADCRRFRHKQGFADSTDFIEVDSSGIYRIDLNGKKHRLHFYTLATCVSMCREGLWVELSPTRDDGVTAPTLTAQRERASRGNTD